MSNTSRGIESLTRADLRGLRRLLFPPCVAHSDQKPYFSFEEKHLWLTATSVAFFMAHVGGESEAETMHVDADALIDAHPVALVEQYRTFILPPATASGPFFSLDNATNWVLPHPFQLFVDNHKSLQLSRAKSSGPAVKNEVSDISLEFQIQTTRKRDMPPEVIEITDSDSSDCGTSNQRIKREPQPERSSSSKNPAKRIKLDPDAAVEPAPSRLKSVSAVIDLTLFESPTAHKSKRVASSKPKTKNNECKPSLSTASKTSDKSRRHLVPSGSKQQVAKRVSPKDLTERWYPDFDRKSDELIRVTKKERVEAIEHVSEIPLSWDVRHELTGFVLDLAESDRFDDGEASSIISMIRSDNQCSWSGSGGKADGDANVIDLLGEGNVLCRRADLECRGIKICEYFNRNLLNDFEGWEVDDKEMAKFWSLELDANETSYLDPDGPLSRFYLRVVESKCKFPGCDGKPVVRRLPLAAAPTRYNKTKFIGCSGWRQGQRGHRCIQLEQNVDEDEFVDVFNNSGKLKKNGGEAEDSEVKVGECCVIVHPRSHRDKCGFTHKIKGHVQPAKIIPYEHQCPSRLLIFEPVDSSVRKALIISKFPHNHPRFAHAKPTYKEKKLVESVVQAAGSGRVTAKALRTSSTTAALLNGKSWEETFPGLVDNQALRKCLKRLNAKEFPKGFEWEGVLYEMEERESKLPDNERYIHSAIIRFGIKIVVTMHPFLAKLIHQVRFLALDFTFKRIRGEFNEWEVASNLDRYKMRASLASLYCNRATRVAFKLLVREFLEVIEAVTGKALRFYFLDKEARLRVFIFDAEAAQMQGCGDAILPLNRPAISGITTEDPLVFVQYFTKTCVQHFIRNIDELSKSVPRDEIERLKRFPNLATAEDIDEWKDLCRSSPHKAVVDWFKQKEVHPWYLPSLNQFLSPMDHDSWVTTPSDSNIVETAHAARNEETSIGAPLLAAILEARYRDSEIVQRIRHFEESGTLGNRWNGPQERESRSAARRDARSRKGQSVRDAQAEYKNLQTELDDLTSKRSLSLNATHETNGQIAALQERLKAPQLPRAEMQLLKDERTKLAKENTARVDERRTWKERMKEIKQSQKVLKDTTLNGSRKQDSRPSSTSSTPCPDSRPSSPSSDGDPSSSSRSSNSSSPSRYSTTLNAAGSSSTSIHGTGGHLPEGDNDDDDTFFDKHAPPQLLDDDIDGTAYASATGDDPFLDIYEAPPVLQHDDAEASEPTLPSTPHRGSQAELTGPAYSPSIENLLAQFPADPVDDVDWANFDWDAKFAELQDQQFMGWHASSAPMGDTKFAQDLNEAGKLIVEVTCSLAVGSLPEEDQMVL